METLVGKCGFQPYLLYIHWDEYQTIDKKIKFYILEQFHDRSFENRDIKLLAEECLACGQQ